MITTKKHRISRLKTLFALIPLFFISLSGFGQDEKAIDSIKGKVVDGATDQPMQSVNIINLNQVEGAITNDEGDFKIRAEVNDTLYFSYLGYKSVHVRVSNDWKKYGDVKVKMTEVGFALEQVDIQNVQLTGFLEIDAKNIPIYEDNRYQISGQDLGYEAGMNLPRGSSTASTISFSPTDALHNIFGKKPRQMRKLRKMKKNDEIQQLLENKYDRETLAALLQVSRDDITEILSHCHYSKSFMKEANDLQILEAINDCYEDYRMKHKN